MMLYNMLGVSDPSKHPCLIGDDIVYQGKVLTPDLRTGFSWKFMGVALGIDQTVGDLCWGDAWMWLNREF